MGGPWKTSVVTWVTTSCFTAIRAVPLRRETIEGCVRYCAARSTVRVEAGASVSYEELPS